MCSDPTKSVFFCFVNGDYQSYVKLGFMLQKRSQFKS